MSLTAKELRNALKGIGELPVYLGDSNEELGTINITEDWVHLSPEDVVLRDDDDDDDAAMDIKRDGWSPGDPQLNHIS